VSYIEIICTLGKISDEIDVSNISKYLFQESKNYSDVSQVALIMLITLLEKVSYVPKTLSVMSNYKVVPMAKAASTVNRSSIYQDLGPSSDEIIERGQNLLTTFADFLFDNSLTLYKMIHHKVFSKTIDGKEYQVIKLNHLFETFDDRGFIVNQKDQICIESILKPIILDLVDVESMRYYMSKLGITEDLPKSTRHLDYTKLKGPTIRVFNSIIQYMDINHIYSIIELIGEDNIDSYEVVSKEKQHKIQVISSKTLRNKLREIGIIPFGEDLNDDFIDFLVLNDEFEDLIMLNKLTRSLKDIGNCEYFQYFGTDRKKDDDVTTPNKNMPKLSRSLSRTDNDKTFKKTLSLKSTIEERKKTVDFDQLKNEDFIDSQKQIPKIPEVDPFELDLKKQRSLDDNSSFKSVNLSEDEADNNNEKRIMMRKKFGLMPTMRVFKYTEE
jgi:hypothetical protein